MCVVFCQWLCILLWRKEREMPMTNDNDWLRERSNDISMLILFYNDDVYSAWWYDERNEENNNIVCQYTEGEMAGKRRRTPLTLSTSLSKIMIIMIMRRRETLSPAYLLLHIPLIIMWNIIIIII